MLKFCRLISSFQKDFFDKKIALYITYYILYMNFYSNQELNQIKNISC